MTTLNITHGVDDPAYVAVDLEFDSADEARAFLKRLEAEVWPASTHLDGTPTARLLETALTRA